MQNRVTWRSKLFLVVGSVAFTAASMGLAGELVVRYRERHRETLQGTMPLLFYRHQRLRHALVRGMDYFGWIHINRQGFRGREVQREKRDGVVRIVVVGSSTTFDPNVSGDDRTWPAQLETWLRQHKSQPIEVINAGVPGYTVLDDLIRLQTELFSYRPDVVILYEGHNDLFDALRSVGTRQFAASRARKATPTPDEVPVATPWGHWLSRHSLLYTKVVSRLQVSRAGVVARDVRGKERRGTTRGETKPLGLEAHFADGFQRDLNSFLAVAQALGIRIVLAELIQEAGSDTTVTLDSASRRNWANTTPWSAPETVVRGYAVYNSVIRDAAARYSDTLIPTAGFGLAGATWYADGDPIHFNDRGAQRMAEQMGQALLAAGVLEIVH